VDTGHSLIHLTCGGIVQEKSPVDPDYGLIEPISLPGAAKIPDGVTGIASSVEYDRYFRLSRDATDLVTWTRTCLTVNKALVEDLDQTGLDGADKVDILAGLVTVQDITLARWVDVAESEGFAR
jgi:hypothetical protein